MADRMLSPGEARQRGLSLDPFEFTDVTDRVPADKPFRQRFYESRWFFVQVTEISTVEEDGRGIPMTWLSIRRNDRKHLSDWRHLQQIKNALCGPEREAANLHPAESRLMDTSNQTHLWVMPEGFLFPFGYQHRSVMTATEAAEFAEKGVAIGSVQRPFDERSEANSRSYDQMQDEWDLQVGTLHRPLWMTCPECGQQHTEFPECPECGHSYKIEDHEPTEDAP